MLRAEVAGARWPVVGLEHPTALVIEDLGLDGSGGWVITGRAGVGKSTMVDSVAVALAAEGEPVERLPFHPDSRAALLSRLATTGRSTLLVVDDLAVLDDASIAAVADLVIERAVRILATTRLSSPLPPLVDGLLASGRLRHHRIDPLDLRLCSLLGESMLGGPLEERAASRLHECSQGVALWVRELVEENRRVGNLVNGDAGWTFLGSPLPPPRILELVASRHVQLAELARSTLELLALAQPLPEAIARDALSEGDLAALERGELVTVAGGTGSPMVTLAHPLYSDAILAHLGSLQRRSIARRAVSLLEAADDPALLARAALLRLDEGLELDAVRALAAGRACIAQGDPVLAERFLAGAGSNYEALLGMGVALGMQGRTAEADGVLLRATEVAGSDVERARALSRRAHVLGVAGGRFTEAVSVLEAGLEEISDESWRSFLEADVAYLRLWSGDRSTHVRVEGAPDGPDVVRINECLSGAVVAVMDGELSAAEGFVREGLPLAGALHDEVPMARELLVLSRFLALAFGGRSREAAEVLGAEVEHGQGGSRLASGSWLAVRALQRHFEGDLVGAIADSTSADELLSGLDFVGLRPLAEAVRSLSLAVYGDIDGSLAADRTVDPTWRDETKVKVLLSMGEAWRLSRRGEASKGAATLVRTGRAALVAHHVVFGALAAHDAVRLGHAVQALPVLRDAAERAEGELVPALLAHAEASATGDAVALLEAAEQLPVLGFRLSGAESAAFAAELFLRNGDLAASRRAEYLAASIAGPLGDVRSPALGNPRGLTPREHEIAALAATGITSREISDRLAISSRTVDNHLAVAYQKLGVGTRRELQDHLPPLAPTGSGRPGG